MLEKDKSSTTSVSASGLQFSLSRSTIHCPYKLLVSNLTRLLVAGENVIHSVSVDSAQLPPLPQPTWWVTLRDKFEDNWVAYSVLNLKPIISPSPLLDNVRQGETIFVITAWSLLPSLTFLWARWVGTGWSIFNSLSFSELASTAVMERTIWLLYTRAESTAGPMTNVFLSRGGNGNWYYCRWQVLGKIKPHCNYFIIVLHSEELFVNLLWHLCCAPFVLLLLECLKPAWGEPM